MQTVIITIVIVVITVTIQAVQTIKCILMTYVMGYSLGHKAEWNGLDGETPTQEPQSQVQVGFNPHTDGSNNTISIDS